MPKPKPNPLFLTIPQTSAEYGLSESTWWELIKNGKIRCFRPAGVRRTLLHRYDIQNLLSGKGAKRDAREEKTKKVGIIPDLNN